MLPDLATVPFPAPLSSYPSSSGLSLGQTLSARVEIDPFNAIATGIFLLAILHTFAAPRIAGLAHAAHHRHAAAVAASGRPPTASVLAELLHFLGEIEVVFGLWALVLMLAITANAGWATAIHYLNDTVNYTEPLFVVVIMALAATRPIVLFAESALRGVAAVGKETPAAWWLAIVTIAPILGSLITEPAAMTIAALLLSRQFYDLEPSIRLKYATLGLLFVNISIGGTLTHFAAPPVLMVARPWGWDTLFMASHFGWRAVLAIGLSSVCYLVIFRRELRSLSSRPAGADLDTPEDGPGATAGVLLPVPLWITLIHMLFLAWTVFNAHYPVLFLGGFLFFIGFARATAGYQSRLDLRPPLLVGFFLAGLVIHGGLQGWWIGPVLSGLPEVPLFLSATALTAVNDNALITYLATLVPDLADSLKVAVVGGAVTGGGLTVIANAPNPAGQAILARFFGVGVSPLYLLLGALVPTCIATLVFHLL